MYTCMIRQTVKYAVEIIVCITSYMYCTCTVNYMLSLLDWVSIIIKRLLCYTR